MLLPLVAVSPSALAVFQQPTGGQRVVSMEAESFHGNTPQGGHAWNLDTNAYPSGYSGSGVMVAQPSNGTMHKTDYVTLSPRLDYAINFTTTGTHYFWIRGFAWHGGDNSVHFGLNGQAVAGADSISIPTPGDYAWSSNIGVIDIPSTGVHTINLWMREDGFYADKIVATPDAAFEPSGLGPSETSQAAGNIPPTARDDAFSVEQDSSGNALAVLADNGSGADSDPDGGTLTVVGTGAVSQGGSAVVNGAGDGVVYTPAAGFAGVETFTYTISDGTDTDQATVTVTVNPSSGGNLSPVARDDAFSVDQDTSANELPVLVDNGSGADFDPDGGPLSVVQVGAASNGGAAQINATDDGVLYTPAAGFTGIETFTYTLSDGIDTDQATVTVTVESTGGGGGGDGAFQQSAGGSQIVSMEAENFHVNTAQGAHQWSTVVSPPAGYSGSGAMITTPNAGDNVSNFVTQSPRLDFQVNFATTGTHYIHVRGYWTSGTDDSVHVGLDGQAIGSADDVHYAFGPEGYVWSSVTRTFNVSSTGLHTVNVWMREDGTPFDKIVLTTDPSYLPSGVGPAESGRTGSATNAPPVARDDAFSVDQDTSGNGLAVLADNGSGADSDPNGDPLTLIAVGATSNGGNAVVNGSDDGIVYAPAPGFTGTETFSYTVSDGIDTDQATVTVTVNAVGGGNQPPVARDDVFIVDQDSSGNALAVLQDNGNGADSDPNGDSLSVVAVGAASNGGNAIVNGSGSGIVYTPASGFSGMETFTYTVSDGTDTDQALVTVMVNAPAGGGGGAYQQGSGGNFIISMEAENFTSNTPQGVHQWVPVTSPPPGYSGSGSMVATPNAGDNIANFVSRSPRLDFEVNFVTTGVHYIHVRGFWTSGKDDSVHVGLDGQAIGSASDVHYAFGPTGYVWSDVTRTITVDNPGLHTVNVWMREDGSPFDKIVLTTNPAFVPTGSGPAESPRSDGSSNQPPMARDDGFSVSQASTGNLLAVLGDNGNGVDFDPEGDALTVVGVGATSDGGSATINGNQDAILYTPAAGFTGTETFTYTLSDGSGTDEATVTVTVNPVSSGSGGTGPFEQQTSDDFIVAMEAENFHLNTAQGSHQWVAIDSPPAGFSGSGGMETTPNLGVNESNYVMLSPRLDFEVNFASSGIHYIHVRGYWLNGKDDSVHLGLDGVAQDSASDVHYAFGTSGYVWSSVTRTINVPTAGVHTVNLWMREDGTLVDRLVLTTNPNWQPSGAGPAESPRETLCDVYPSVSLVSPVTNHIQSSSDLDVETITCLDPQIHGTWGVKFELDGGVAAGGQEAFRFGPPYAARFSGLAKAEHTVEAIVVDGAGNPVTGGSVSDVASNVGVGDYYVAIGDSITNGTGDDIASDDTSSDGRSDSRGYPPILADLLAANARHPVIVANEGVGGITSAGGLGLLPGVIAGHPEAEQYLVKYGMNDARPWLPVPSGLGLQPGDAGYPGTFKDNMQQIIDLLENAGKEVVLAKVNIALGDGASTEPPYPDPNLGARSLLIQEYNQVVDELVVAPGNSISIAPPDFYSYFQANAATEYGDNIHPNGIGYQSMADLWFQVIAQ